MPAHLLGKLSKEEPCRLDVDPGMGDDFGESFPLGEGLGGAFCPIQGAREVRNGFSWMADILNLSTFVGTISVENSRLSDGSIASLVARASLQINRGGALVVVPPRHCKQSIRILDGTG